MCGRERIAKSVVGCFTSASNDIDSNPSLKKLIVYLPYGKFLISNDPMSVVCAVALKSLLFIVTVAPATGACVSASFRTPFRIDVCAVESNGINNNSISRPLSGKFNFIGYR